jgi:hypothetical protein
LPKLNCGDFARFGKISLSVKLKLMIFARLFALGTLYSVLRKIVALGEAKRVEDKAFLFRFGIGDDGDIFAITNLCLDWVSVGMSG